MCTRVSWTPTTSTWTDAPMISAATVAEVTMEALERDELEVLADEQRRSAEAALSEPVTEPSGP
ncbi:hypothetical protein [Nonomuraea fuscirosea]|uniref:hypothetical protein n=1 Tax=Nonomuraea fuscirosea TaxID=1291556 RepID=UPI0034159760